MRVSAQILEVLWRAKTGRMLNPPAPTGQGSQSRTVGRGTTIATCRRRGYLDYGSDQITEAGLAILAHEATLVEAGREREDRAAIRKITHWERGYRCHGLWRDKDRVASIGLGPMHLWDGIYRWSLDEPGVAKGEAATLAEAKRAVEDALLSDLANSILMKGAAE